MKKIKPEKLIGKRVYITDKNSIYYQDWGIIKALNGDSFAVAIANGDDKHSYPIFDRDQFQIPRNQDKNYGGVK